MSENDILRPSKKGEENGAPYVNGQSHNGAIKTNYQNGSAVDPKDEHEKVKQKQDYHSKESPLNINEGRNWANGKESVGGSKKMGETSENFYPNSIYKAKKHPNANVYPNVEHSSPNSISKETNYPNAYVYLNVEFIDFDKDRKNNVLRLGRFGLSMIQQMACLDSML
ncbi:hypothetical protein RYX36_028711 [Vicia faba]